MMETVCRFISMAVGKAMSFVYGSDWTIAVRHARKCLSMAEEALSKDGMAYVSEEDGIGADISECRRILDFIESACKRELDSASEVNNEQIR